MTATLPSAPPGNRANRVRIALSRTLSSAPPMTMTGPAVPSPATPQSSRPVPMPRSVTSPVYRRDPLRPGGSVILPHAALGAAGWPQDQLVVRFDDVHDA